MKKEKQDSSANPKHIHKVYSELLKLLDLTLEHRKALNTRGLTEKEVAQLGYKSMPLRKQEVTASLIKKCGAVAGVPGFWKNGNNWDCAGKTGILIPVRSRDGLITGLKIRVDKPVRSSAKYILLSSNPHGERAFPQGTAAKTSIHWPLTIAKMNRHVIRITEGELKADIATSLTDVFTISLPGVRMWRMAMDAVKESKAKEVLIAFDADKSEEKGGGYAGDDGMETEAEPFQVGKATASLFLLLKEHVSAFIEDWPKDAGKGIDDVLLNGAQDQITRITGEEADKWCEEMLRGNLPSAWVYIVGTKQFINVESLITLDKEQFNDQFRREIKGTPSTVVLSNPAFPLFVSPIYMPQEKIEIVQNGRRLFNLWRPQASIVPDKKVKAKPFLDHAQYMIPDERERNIFLDFMAWNIQHPGKKILWSMLLQSGEGVGKSYFGDVLMMLLGKENVSKPSNDEIHEIYTGWAKNCSLVIIEELMARGRMDLMNRLKPIVTQADIQIREMYCPPYSQPNVFNILIFTNYEDSLITGQDDRRYCIIYSKQKAQDAKYYRELWDWTRAHPGAILHWLMERDLSSFDPQARAPHTSWKQQLIYASMPPLQQWMMECIDTETWPFQSDIIGTLHLKQCLPREFTGISIKALGDALRAVGCRQYDRNEGQIEFSTGARARMWSVRRHEVWASAEAGTWIHEYEKWSVEKEPGNPLWDARPM
jgi:hypothetical protein